MQNIVLLHGALGSSEDLIPLDLALKKRGLTVYSFSFSGHGTTQFKTRFGIAQFAVELEEFIREKDLKNTCVFGYSMGGFVALCLSLRQKDLIQKIITLGTKFNWSKEAVEKETKMLDPEKMAEKIPAYVKMLETKHGEAWKELVLKTADMMRELGRKDFLNNEALKDIVIPVWLGIADKDQMVTLDETSQAFRQLPNASMYMLPGSKHQLESINVTMLSGLIVDFMNSG